jgi:D-3-phosphoglycerate dehydrogenase / 2-oxoglutarate reductase
VATLGCSVAERKSYNPRMKLVRWGWSEYETPDIPGLPPGVEAIAVSGREAPLEEADMLVVPSTVRVDAAAVSRLRRCRLVLTTTSGFDQLDLGALRAAGIAAARLPLARRDAVVETALGMILSLTRRLGLFQEAARGGHWERPRLARYGATLLGTVGVVGVGVIGARIVEALQALQAQVLRCDPLLPDGQPLAQLLAESDVLTLHCELTPDTRGMINRDAIYSLRRGAILVNTARGALVDVDAAVGAVRDGHLGGLGLDVFEKEPADLSGYVHPRIIVTPHAAGWHPGLGTRIAEGIVDATRALMEGRAVPFRI